MTAWRDAGLRKYLHTSLFWRQDALLFKQGILRRFGRHIDGIVHIDGEGEDNNRDQGDEDCQLRRRQDGRRRGMKGPDCLPALPVHKCMKYVGDALVARAPNDGLGASARSVHTYPAHAPWRPAAARYLPTYL